MAHPIPLPPPEMNNPSDHERMLTLQSLGATDDEVGASLDRLTELTAYTFGAQAAFVSLVEVERQRFVSKVGLAIDQTGIRDAVCAATIGSPNVLVIRDLRLDERFCGIPLVTAPPHFRFYAGAPLIAANGTAIGTLCIMDARPREFSTADERQLETLGRAVLHQLELRALSGRREPVSGLANRQQFALDYEGFASRNAKQGRFAAIIDVLDMAKASEIGQVLGMAPLEALIKRTGMRLQTAVGDKATIYHVGVSRFAFLMEAGSPAEFEAVLEALATRVVRPVMAGCVPIVPIFRAGAYRVSLSIDSGSDVIRKTLVGLHAAITARSAIQWYSHEQDNRLSRGYRLATDAQRGLPKGEFYLEFQPRFWAKDLSPVSAEALIRWNHPRMGPVSPGEFIPVFERTVLIESMSEWVLAEGLRQFAQWRARGVTLSLSINLSVRDISSPSAAAQLLEAIYASGLAPSDVEVEITEGEWLRADSDADEQLVIMAAAGIRIAIDDFGTGYSNFSYLTELPIHTLKIDKTLIDDVATDPRAAMKVKAIIGLARDLGYLTVAEGVETADQIACLQKLGCDQLQGFALARPMLPDKLDAVTEISTATWTSAELG